MPIVVRQPTGQSLYVRFDDASNTAVNLTEGTGLKLGRYTATDAAIVTAALAAGTYSAGVFVGTAAAQANTDYRVGEIDEFKWSGTVEIVSSASIAEILADTTVIGAPAGASIAADIAANGGLDAAETRTALGLAAANLDTQLDGLEPGTLTDIDLENVPTARVFLLVPDEDEGLVGEKPKGATVGTSPTYAMEFRSDIPVGGKINIVGTPTIESGTAGGITFSAVGRDKSQAKFRATFVTAGTYEVRCEVEYDTGATAAGTVTFNVVD